MVNTTNDIIISEKERPVWQRIVAVVAYVLMCFFLGLMVYGVYHYPGRQGFKAFVSCFNFAFFMFVIGIRFSVVTAVCFDLVERCYKKQFRVGSIKVGRWKQLPDIEYVSVFRQPIIVPGKYDAHIYNVNIWYGQNRHFTIYNNAENKKAYNMALYIATRLKIELLDVTDPQNKIWLTPWVEVESFGLPPVKMNKRGLR
ncbi:hypothetical protein GR160_16235 [Flavobacterium sp. Sd200]|uniref:hypothetical protein n=1 Tax=Flavobacterium sp. Sd200 TaxID=2692211 RepID=UPI00136A4339|nr:hypothetical protein [Flavobacterium sp. Sd200]MXN92778.1 hypothetical protein [Flavobacterium sp. Sd200]